MMKLRYDIEHFEICGRIWKVHNFSKRFTWYHWAENGNGLAVSECAFSRRYDCFRGLVQYLDRMAGTKGIVHHNPCAFEGGLARNVIPIFAFNFGDRVKVDWVKFYERCSYERWEC